MLALILYVVVTPVTAAVAVGVLWGLFSDPLPDDENFVEGEF